MTNAQKWVTVFLVLFILLLLLSKMTTRQNSDSKSEMTNNIETATTESAQISVTNLMANNRCFTCHGSDLKGTGMGPSLAKVSENWRKVNLVSYLKNPKAFLNNPRLAKLKSDYRREMPAVENMTEEELNAVAEYLVGEK